MDNTQSGQEKRPSAEDERFLRAIYYDNLTGLLSMTRFYELAQSTKEAIEARGERPSMLFIDLSGMKYYNRKHGFDKGDELLCNFARLLRKHFGDSDCSRFGQDHFVVNTSGSGLDDKLHTLFDDWKELYGRTALAIRVGIYQRAEQLIGFAAACDRAKMACDTMRKSHHSGIRYFTDDLLADMELRQFVLENFDNALQEGHIRVFYQPIVRSLNGTVCNEEALSRWNDPERGLLTPNVYIPVLEEANVIYKLDLYVVEQVLKKIQMLSRTGFPIKTHSINLSRDDFFTCEIVEEIRKRVDASGIDHDRIAIEITESTIGSDFNYIKEQVRKFRSLGFPVWIDDFGSGYSSLDVLQSIEFDLIKFDMLFMKQFNKGNGKIILTELLKMAAALHVDTICEGVETEEQVFFLREAGCAKMQGFYYGKPKLPEVILELHRCGGQIGFEDPEEIDYYEAVSRVNLHDLNSLTNENSDRFHNYFSSLPMAVMEIKYRNLRFIRSNHSFRDFVRRYFGIEIRQVDSVGYKESYGLSETFLEVVRRCISDGGSFFVTENLRKTNSTIHFFIRRLAVNPVTGASAMAVAVLYVMDAEEGTTYEHIAKALAADYFNLFYVNIEDESYIEYSSDVGKENMAVERRGDHFFKESRQAALTLLYKDDRKGFVAAFTKENILKALDEQGTFTLIYRMLRNGEPVYVNMKAMRMDPDQKHLIIAVSNIDAQMKQQAAYAEYQKEKIIYKRIHALFGDFICLYTVDPETDHYIQSSASMTYENFGIAHEGDDFFSESHKSGMLTVAPEDFEKYRRSFTKENVLNEIRKNGVYLFYYHLIIDGKKISACLRAALDNERGFERLIIGVSREE